MTEDDLTLDDTWREEAQRLDLEITPGRPEWSPPPKAAPRPSDRTNLLNLRELMQTIWPAEE